MARLSNRALAEMARGRHEVEKAAAYERAHTFENRMNERAALLPFPFKRVTVEVSYTTTQVLMTTNVRTKEGTIAFPTEPSDAFPSDTLKTQLMLLLG